MIESVRKKCQYSLNARSYDSSNNTIKMTILNKIIIYEAYLRFERLLEIWKSKRGSNSLHSSNYLWESFDKYYKTMNRLKLVTKLRLVNKGAVMRNRTHYSCMQTIKVERVKRKLSEVKSKRSSSYGKHGRNFMLN